MSDLENHEEIQANDEARSPRCKTESLMTTPPDLTDNNPYIASEVMERVVDQSQRSQPGPLAIISSVLLGLVVAFVVFVATFFFTCLGLSSTKTLDNRFGFVLLLLIAGITAIAAFVFTLWGILKIVRAMKQKN